MVNLHVQALKFYMWIQFLNLCASNPVHPPRAPWIRSQLHHFFYVSFVSKGLPLGILGIYVTAYLSQSAFLSANFEMLGIKCCLFYPLNLDFMKNSFLLFFGISNKLSAEDSP